MIPELKVDQEVSLIHTLVRAAVIGTVKAVQDQDYLINVPMPNGDIETYLFNKETGKCKNEPETYWEINSSQNLLDNKMIFEIHDN